MEIGEWSYLWSLSWCSFFFLQLSSFSPSWQVQILFLSFCCVPLFLVLTFSSANLIFGSDEISYLAFWKSQSKCNSQLHSPIAASAMFLTKTKWGSPLIAWLLTLQPKIASLKLLSSPWFHHGEKQTQHY